MDIIERKSRLHCYTCLKRKPHLKPLFWLLDAAYLDIPQTGVFCEDCYDRGLRDALTYETEDELLCAITTLRLTQ